MALAVDPPSPPRIIEPGDGADDGDDFLRSEIQDHLESGAWVDAFEAWAAETAMTEREFAIAHDLGLFDRFDFFWDDFAGRVGYAAPGIPEDWKERGYHADLETWSHVSSINAGMAELGQTVCDVLKADYLEVEADEGTDHPDLPEFE